MLKPKDREELIIRTNETVRNIWRVAEKLERHQEFQNSNIATALQSCARNGAWIKIGKWVIGGIVVIGTAAITTHLQGLW